MSQPTAKLLIGEYQRAVRSLSNLVAPWPMEKLIRKSTQDNGSGLEILVKSIQEGFGSIAWLQKSAGLPSLMQPEALKYLDQGDLESIKRVLTLLGPYAGEALSGLTDENLQYRPLREYTILQMFEHAIIQIWLAVAKLEQLDR